jgi:hypothetical protein
MSNQRSVRSLIAHRSLLTALAHCLPVIAHCSRVHLLRGS